MWYPIQSFQNYEQLLLDTELFQKVMFNLR